VSEPAVSCVVVAYHRPASLATLVASLRHPDVEIVVVNVEDDPEVRAVAAPARHLATPGNVGYAAAVNLGVERARGDVVAFMNDDLDVDAATVLALADVVASGRAAVAVPAVVDGSGRSQRTIAALPSVGRLALEWLLLPDCPPALLAGRSWGVEKWRRPLAPEPVDAAAAVLVVTTTTLLRRHPLPEGYFLYWEEHEWFWRLRQEGARVEHRPDLRCAHAGGPGDLRPDKARLLARNALLCVRRTQGRRRAVAAFPVVVAWQLRLWIVEALRCAIDQRRPRGRLVARRAGLRAALGAVGLVAGAHVGATTPPGTLVGDGAEPSAA
jgi:GT2 family glycosyltransferase